MPRVRKRRTDPATAPAYPRPMLQRDAWASLDGMWEFAIDAAGTIRAPAGVRWGETIRVPFAPETPASGVGRSGYFQACWYRRRFDRPAKLQKNQRLVLHCAAVDYHATVWVNGALAVTHEGGYTPFSADVTDLLIPGKQQTLVVRAGDDPHDLAKPRGKQDWLPEPHSIWYPRTSGIWQTVWIEVVNETRIKTIRWTTNVRRWEVGLRARIEGQHAPGARLRVKFSTRGQTLVEDEYSVERGEVDRAIRLADPGIDDARNHLLWSPGAPNLIDAELTLVSVDGIILDRVRSYCGMRSIQTSGDRFILNGRPLQLQLVLNQGYWAESGLTAPDDDALRRDVELIKEMGFNGCRMHQKIESPRFHYWADRLGLLVWEEMPSAYQFSDASVKRLTRQWMEVIERDASHPCIVAWVPFNESWGVPDLPNSRPQRDAVSAMYHLTRALDATRPVVGNDGWEACQTDVIGIHDYEPDPAALARRYDTQQDGAVVRMLGSERPGNKGLILDGHAYAGQPIMLTEFGGIAYSRDTNGTWGYSRARSADELALRYARLLSVVRGLPVFSGFCYTQFTDTYQEGNGLLFMDRTPKFPLDELACATRGARTEADRQIESKWQARLTAIEESAIRG